MKEKLFAQIDSYQDAMVRLADEIYDHPELALQEYFAADALCTYLEQQGFSVTRHVGGLETAFRTEIRNKSGGPSIGLLAEYDALPGVNHACGHHMQGPVMIAALMGLCSVLPKESPWTLVLYGTPGEEGGGGKIIMGNNGCFRDIDVALMMHGGDMTTYDPTMSANVAYTVTFSKQPADPALHTSADNRAAEALLLSMEGVEFMREHMIECARIHYAPRLAEGADIAPEQAEGSFMLRCLRDGYLDDMIQRFQGILEGAALMTDTTYTAKSGLRMCACFPNEPLAEIFYKNAKLAKAPRIAPPRGTMGSTDFGNVMQYVPGFCARVAFAPQGTGAHSLSWLEAGKTAQAHDCILTSAKIIAGMAYDIITDPALFKAIQADYLIQRKKSVS